MYRTRFLCKHVRPYLARVVNITTDDKVARKAAYLFIQPSECCPDLLIGQEDERALLVETAEMVET